jgi:branched-chain amino acid transport system substrate-binding protein
MTFRRVLAACLIAAATLLSAARAAETVKIGAVECLTGPAAKYGVMIRSGFELAADDINGGGGVLGGRPLQLLFEDSAGQKEQAIDAVRKLIARDRVVALLGPTLSNEMLAAGPVANERGLPIIGTSTTAKGITEIGPWVFRTSLPESQVLPVTLAAAKAKFGLHRVALLYSNDDAFTKSGFDVFKESLDKLGIDIAAVESFSTKDTNFSAQLTKIKGLGVDALVVSALAEAGSGLVLQARQLGLSQPIVGGNGFNSPKIAEIAGPAADGVVVGSPWFVGKAGVLNQGFVEAFQKKFDQAPDQFAAQAYDTLHILAAAIDRAGATDPVKLKTALLATDYTGLLGPFRFTPGRDPASAEGVAVTVIQGGKPTLLP